MEETAVNMPIEAALARGLDWIHDLLQVNDASLGLH